MRRVLIANRGEIAVRVIRACRELGLETVAVYSEADAGALHVTLADYAVPIGPAPARESYLDAGRLLETASRSGADAVHPGYGFLSENADFAAAVQAAGLVWIGPRPEVMRLMGDKLAAKRAAAQAGLLTLGEPVAVAKGSNGAWTVDGADRLPYPLLIKAAAGGGGRGMRRVDRAENLVKSLDSAAREAASAFGDGTLLLEPYVEGARHIEVQVAGDNYGDVRHLWERDCSIQRRHQKVIEESPAPGLQEETRAILAESAAQAARSVGYTSLGTLEFLMAPDGRFYFLEMNTRLQVEHGVTELVTGVDLVQTQIRLAKGERMEDLRPPRTTRGHGIQARIYAEDPEKGYLPSPGRISLLRLPEGPGVRVDHGVREGDVVSQHYDTLLAKVLTFGRNREEARRRLQAALAEMTIGGVKTNLRQLRAVLASGEFTRFELRTDFLDRLDRLSPEPVPDEAFAAAGAFLAAQGSGWRAGEYRFDLVCVEERRRVVCRDGAGVVEDGPRFSVETGPGWVRLSPEGGPATTAAVAPEGGGVWVGVRGEAHLVKPALLPPPDFFEQTAGAAGTSGQVLSPLPGVVREVRVADGAKVSARQVILVLEAMKMEHLVEAPLAGTVSLAVAAGEQVAADQLLAEIR